MRHDPRPETAVSKATEAAPAFRETEIKFEIDPKDAARLARTGWLKGLARGRPSVQRLNATYFDTVDLKIRQAGMSLRVRKEGRRYVQCIKADDNSGHFTRKEWQADAPGGRPDTRLMADAPGAEALPPVEPGDLVPVFESRIRRTHRTLTPRAGQRIACDFDIGEITAGGVTRPVCEVELELLSGDPREMYDIAYRLLGEIPARLSGGSKSDRGYALLTGGQPQWRKAHPPELSPDSSAEEALGQMILACLDHLRANEACALARTHIEGIHQMRVALRRLRSVFGLFKPFLPPEQHREITGELKWAIGELADARDWDVFVGEVLEPIGRWQGESEGLALLKAAAAERQDNAYQHAHAAIRDTRYTRLLLRLASWVDGREWRAAPDAPEAGVLYQPARALADRLLARRHRKVEKGGKHFKKLDETQRHDLRISIKKLRYAIELFQTLYPRKEAVEFAKALADIQDGLGVLNDLAVARDLLSHLAPADGGVEARRLHFAAGMVLGWHAHLAEDHMRGINKSWKRFRMLEAFWSAG